MGMKRLVFAAPAPLDLATGGYVYDRRIVQGLRALGWDVRVAELPSGFPAPTADELDAAARWLEDLPPGVPVVIDGLAFGAMPEQVRAEAERLRLIALVHHPLADETGLDALTVERLRDAETVALEAATGVIVTSPFTARRLDAFGVPPGRLRVVEPGVDRQPLAAGSTGDPTLLCVASYSQRKGHDVLLRALARVRHPWRLVCVGAVGLDAEHEARVRALAADFGNRVTLLGPQPQADLQALYHEADLFVLASYYEGYGMVLAEAIAAGLPIVATAGGATRTTAPADASLLVQAGDVTALAAALERVLGDAELRARLTLGARAARERQADWPTAAAAFARAVQELVA
ncbi:MAG: glycosyltransferase family 1 protein [Geminicoccaceae bacterium]|nr:MAG: glycosyltransferase family 1 protein [Geminicoccaceae bacterium]